MSDVIFFKNQEEMHAWLELNHAKQTEVWVGFYKQGSRKLSFTWSESVDIALCFGWIDGIRKSIDKESYKIRFSPRKIDSVWSAVNVKKVQNLLQMGKMRPEGILLFDNRNDVKGYSSEQRNIPLDKKYEESLKANAPAWQYFTSLAPSYRRDSIWWVMTAKKEETRDKRLHVLIESSAAGQKIPMLRKHK
ncbi:YdeI/OmpD-associated family protein [Vibrio pacinii]|uniref:YdeI/OmpD-associated family protein n=1 Tax=Vibrio pacinii TaxID=170674 RepID=UPI00057099F8|nr:YdeI/OmpD-associated family protein [Vibrio pacinii]